MRLGSFITKLKDILTSFAIPKVACRLPVSLAIAATFVISSCEVHEWPTPQPTDIILNFDFDTDMPLYMVLNVGETRSSLDGNAYEARYTVEAYPLSTDGTCADSPSRRYTFTRADFSELNTSVRLSIDEGYYRFYVWTDFVKKGMSTDLLYNTSNFRDIRLQGEHEGNNDYRDAFIGNAELLVKRGAAADAPAEATVPMERPLAKFEFISTDLQEFITKAMEELSKKKAGQTDARDGDAVDPAIDLSKYRVVFYYSGYMPCEFNIMDNKPCDSMTGVSFESTIKAVDEHEARLGFDYVFVNGKESSVMVTVALLDEDGTQLSRSNQIEVPLKRSMLTVVKGSFLIQETGGGVAIDPDFEGEFNIVL